MDIGSDRAVAVDDRLQDGNGLFFEDDGILELSAVALIPRESPVNVGEGFKEGRFVAIGGDDGTEDIGRTLELLEVV